MAVLSEAPEVPGVGGDMSGRSQSSSDVSTGSPSFAPLVDRRLVWRASALARRSCRVRLKLASMAFAAAMEAGRPDLRGWSRFAKGEAKGSG